MADKVGEGMVGKTKKGFSEEKGWWRRHSAQVERRYGTWRGRPRENDQGGKGFLVDNMVGASGGFERQDWWEGHSSEPDNAYRVVAGCCRSHMTDEDIRLLDRLGKYVNQDIGDRIVSREVDVELIRVVVTARVEEWPDPDRDKKNRVYEQKTICFALSPRRPYGEYKRMVLEHTHGLFIT
jgi:hypothetical protein